MAEAPDASYGELVDGGHCLKSSILLPFALALGNVFESRRLHRPLGAGADLGAALNALSQERDQGFPHCCCVPSLDMPSERHGTSNCLLSS